MNKVFLKFLFTTKLPYYKFLFSLVVFESICFSVCLPEFMIIIKQVFLKDEKWCIILFCMSIFLITDQVAPFLSLLASYINWSVNSLRVKH